MWNIVSKDIGHRKRVRGWRYGRCIKLIELVHIRENPGKLTGKESDFSFSNLQTRQVGHVPNGILINRAHQKYLGVGGSPLMLGRYPAATPWSRTARDWIPFQ